MDNPADSAVSSPEAVSEAFIRAINRQDVDAMTALMRPEHRFVDSLGSVVEGREKMQVSWNAYFRMVPDYTIAVDEIFIDGPLVILLGIAKGTYTQDGKLYPGNQWHTPIALRAFVEGGLLSEWRVYADNEPIRKLISASG